jgi:hypothetical protein
MQRYKDATYDISISSLLYSYIYIIRDIDRLNLHRLHKNHAEGRMIFLVIITFHI